MYNINYSNATMQYVHFQLIHHVVSIFGFMKHTYNITVTLISTGVINKV